MAREAELPGRGSQARAWEPAAKLTKSATSAKMTFMGQKDSPPPRPPRTEVFISAASADLKGARARVQRAVNTIRCHGVYQEEFPPDYRRVEEMLRSLIEECDAVIHIAGVCYGSEPKNRPSEKPRRSYTQMEYDIAQELGRPLYVFVCAETFPYDPHSPEADDTAALQKAHREACLGRAEFRETVATTGELETRVSQLQEHLRRLERQILETSDAIKVVRDQVDEVQSLQRVHNEKLDKQDDRLSKSLRADLRAKLTRAEELHARDENKESVALLEEVYHTARSHGLKEEQLEATLNLGFITSQEHDFKAVERRLREANKLLRNVKGAWHHIQYYRLRSKVLRHKKQPSPAEKSLQKAIALSQSSDANVAQVGLLARASYIHLLCDQKRPNEADEHLACAREVVEGPQGRHPVAVIAELLEACIHWAISKADTNKVNAYVRIVLRHGAGREAAICIGHALHDCANGARGMKATDAAVICAEAAERLGHVALRPDMAFVAAYTAAAALADKENFYAVRERCVRLLDSAKTLAEPKLGSSLFALLSIACRQLGDKTTAVEAAETALRDSEENSILLYLSKMALAEALRDSGRVKEAMGQARTAFDLSQSCDAPPEWVEQTLTVIADCAARLGDWTTAEKYSSQLGKRPPATSDSMHRRKMLENRIQMHRMVRDSLTSVISATAPLSVARTEGADSVQIANAMLMQDLVVAWEAYPNAAAKIYDYWGRGNLLRVMLNMRAFPRAFNMTIEVHTVAEARQAIRLWALIADVLVLIWKGPTVSSHVVCPVPASFYDAGGGGYFMTVVDSSPAEVARTFGLGSGQVVLPSDGKTPAVMARYASLLPDEVARFLREEAAHLVSLGRLIVIPATGICCVGSGHGPLESLFAEACNAIPAIKGDAAMFPASWVPYFPDIPLRALANIAQEHEESLRRFRVLLFRKTRQFRSSGLTGSESKELELEIQDSIAQINDIQAGLRRKHGWGEAREAVASRYDGFSEQSVAPILVLQNMGYRWRVEHAIGGSTAEPNVLPTSDEPIGTWLHPPDTKPELLTGDHVRNLRNMRRKGR